VGLIHKQVTVHFFSVEVDDKAVSKIVATFTSLRKLGSGTDVVNLPQSRYLIHYISGNSRLDGPLLFWSTVKERNTWQVRTKQDGSLLTLHDSNSIVGDTSFYKFDPARRVLAAFTTYPATGYLKALCSSVFQRLLPRSTSFSIEYLSDDQKITQIKKWDYYSRISIKLDTTNIAENDDKPDLIKALLSFKETFGGNTISVTLNSGQDKLPKQDVTETINYLSSSESCESLQVAGGMYGNEERILAINLKYAFIKYRTFVELRADQKHIDIMDADRVLSEAFISTELPPLSP